MGIMSENVDFTNSDGKRFADDLQRVYLALKNLTQTNKIDEGSGLFSRLAFYAEEDELVNIQNSMIASSIMFVATQIQGKPEIFIVTKSAIYPLISLISVGGIKTINKIKGDNLGNVSLDGDALLDVVNDDTTSTISLDTSKISAEIAKKIEQIVSISTGISVTSAGSTRRLELVLANFVSSMAGNLIKIEGDSILVKQGDINAIKNINGLTSSSIVLNAGDHISITEDINGTKITIAVNSSTLPPTLISSDANNDLKTGTDSKLYVSSGPATTGTVETIQGVSPTTAGDVGLDSSNVAVTVSPVTAQNKITLGLNEASLIQNIISQDAGNQLSQKQDGMYVAGGAVGVTSFNGTTGDVTISSGKGIKITQNVKDFVIENTGGGGGPSKEIGQSNAFYMSIGVIPNADGSIDKPFDASTELVDAYSGINPTKTIILGVPSKMPLATTTSELVVTECIPIHTAELPDLGITGGVNFQLYGANDSDHVFNMHYKDITSTTVPLVQYQGIFADPSTIPSRLSNININVNSLNTNNDLEVFKCVSTNTPNSSIKNLHVKIEAQNLQCITSNPTPTPNTALINLTRPSALIERVHVTLDVEHLKLNSSSPPVVKHKAVIGKGANDTVILICDDFVTLNKYVDLDGVDEVHTPEITIKDGLITTNQITIPSFTTDVAIGVQPLGSIYYNTTSNSILVSDGVKWNNLSADAVLDMPIADSVYYDDNSTSPTEDGSYLNPYKTIQSAVTSAIDKGTTTTRLHTVRAKPSTSLLVSDAIKIGETNKNISIRMHMPDQTLSGDISIDLSSDATLDENRVWIKCLQCNSKIKTINPTTVATLAEVKQGIFIDLETSKRKLFPDSVNFACDLSSITSNSYLVHDFVSYLETIRELVTDETAQPTSNAIVFTIPKTILGGTFRVHSVISSTTTKGDFSAQRIPYISFKGSPDGTVGGKDKLVTIEALAGNDKIYQFDASPDGATGFTIISSDGINCSSIEANRVTALENITDTLDVSRAVKLPSDGASSSRDGQIYYDTSTGQVFAVSKGVKKALRFDTGSSNTPTYNEVLADAGMKYFPEAHQIILKAGSRIKELSSTGSINHDRTLAIGDSEEKIINIRRKPIASLSLLPYKTTDEYVSTNDTEGHPLLLFIADINVTATLIASATPNVLRLSIEYDTQYNQIMLDNVKQGFVYSFTSDASQVYKEPLPFAVMSAPTTSPGGLGTIMTLDAVTGTGSGSGSVGPDSYVQPVVSDFNSVQYNKVHIGCGLTCFSEDSASTFSVGRYCQIQYFPVMYQGKDNETASSMSVVLIPHVAVDFGNHRPNTLAGERTFKKEIIPPIVATKMKALLRIANDADMKIEWIRVPIPASTASATSLAVLQNKGVQITGFDANIFGDVWGIEYTSVFSITDVTTIPTLTSIASSIVTNKNVIIPRLGNNRVAVSSALFQDIPFDELWTYEAELVSTPDGDGYVQFFGGMSGMQAIPDVVEGTIQSSRQRVPSATTNQLTKITKSNYSHFMGLGTLPTGGGEKPEGDIIFTTLAITVFSQSVLCPFKCKYKMCSQNRLNKRTNASPYQSPPPIALPNTASVNPNSTIIFQ